MKKKSPNRKWEELPEIITPLDYADAVGIGAAKSREIFKSKNFPRVPGTGVKQLAYRDAARAFSEGNNNFKRNEDSLNKEVVELLTDIKSLLTEFAAQHIN